MESTHDETRTATTPARNHLEPQVDHAESVDTLVTKLQAGPDDQATLDELLVAAEGWVAADGLEQPAENESTARPRLAEWLAHLSCGGTVVHHGWREGAVATALATTGAAVVSHLDHPGRGRAMATACNLQPKYRVLEPGCDTSRNARALQSTSTRNRNRKRVSISAPGHRVGRKAQHQETPQR